MAAPGASAGAGESGPPTALRGRGRQAASPLPRLLRVAAWVLAVPFALVLVGIPARKAGYLNGQRMLDIIVKHNLGRFVPLLVIVVLWALVTAVLVTVFLEGGRKVLSRRAPATAAA